MNLLEALVNALRLPELRNKILFTAGMLVVLRVFAQVSIPGANQQALTQLFSGSALLGLLNLFSGGGLQTFSVVAMGVNPYINAIIIMQLLGVVSERINEINKEGEMGRQRISRWTRWLTVGLALLQAYGYTVLFQNTNPAILSPKMALGTRLLVMLTLTGGTVMMMWFGELITEYGIGNGISLVIFAGIIGQGPGALIGAIQTHLAQGGGLTALTPLFGFAAIAFAVTMVIIEFQQAIRKVPIQSAQRILRGTTVPARSSFMPLRVNQAGVIPIIFAISIMFFPTIVANYLAGFPPHSIEGQYSAWVRTYFIPNSPNMYALIGYNCAYFLLTVLFTFFYTAVTFKPDEAADNLKKASSFVPGIRPGVPTAEYLGRVMNRITLAGGLFLGFITVVLPLATADLTGINSTQLYLGGTAILIIVGVALDTMRQLETQLVMRQYRGFIH